MERAGPRRARPAPRPRRAGGSSGAARRRGSVAALDGTACTTFAGEAGTIDVGVTATDLVIAHLRGRHDAATRRSVGGSSINEIDYDQMGADTGGFVEIHNTALGRRSLEGLALVLVNGGDSAEYDRENADRHARAGGYLVVDIDRAKRRAGRRRVDRHRHRARCSTRCRTRGRSRPP